MIRSSSILCAALIAVVALAPGCTKKAVVAKTGVDVITPRDVSPILRGTVGSEVSLSGLDPIYVTGYGVVVGLAGTGSTDVPLSVRAFLEDEMSRLGVGAGETSLSNITPWELLADKNTAVVLVQGLVPPAAPDGEKFDVRVDVLAGTAATSLEGGTLYTTQLFQGIAIPTGPAVRSVANARGDLFINPFQDPAKDPLSEGGSPRTTGRVLGGATVSTPFKPLLIMDTPSHSRARAIVASINARFPRQGDREVTARGINEDSIELNVPAEFRTRPREFFDLVLHLRVDRTFPEEWASRYAEALKEEPELANDLSWCLRALGDVSIPSLRTLYDYPEVQPRMAALEAGAWLGDPLSRPHLEEIARSGPVGLRAPAVGLMSRLPSDPRVTRFLLDMLSNEDVTIRVAAYEALDRLNSQFIRRRWAPEKFRLDIAPSSEPMVYVRQQGEPRLVLFGELEVEEPTFVYGWDGRLIVSRENGEDASRLLFRDHRSTKVWEESLGTRLEDVIVFAGRKPTPEDPRPGLDLSYSDTVGVVHEILIAGGVDAAFVPEEDKLALELIRLRERGQLETRPELSTEDEWEPPAEGLIDATLVGEDQTDADDEDDPEREERRQKYVVPLRPPPDNASLESGDGG